MSWYALPVSISLLGTEKVSESGCEAEVGAPVRPRPPGATPLPLPDLTVEGLADQAEMAGLARLVAGPPDGPSDGKASSELWSTGAEDEEAPLALVAAEVDLGAGLFPMVGKGSGAPSSPCRYTPKRQHATCRLRFSRGELTF